MKGICRDQWMILAIVAVALVAFTLVVYLPQRRQLGELKQQRQETATALERDKTRATELALIRGEVTRMTEQLNYFNRRLPNQQELGQFLKDVSGYARSSGLDGATFQPQKPVQGELYVRMPIEMHFQGRFSDLYGFLRQAKNMTRLTHVREMTVRNDKDLGGRCAIDMTMTIYFTRG